MIAPLLITKRVANRSALTGHIVTAGHASSLDARPQGGATDSDGTPLGEYLTNSAGGYGKNPDEPVVVVDCRFPSGQ